MANPNRLHGPQAREAARRAAERLAVDARIQLVFLFGSSADEGRAEVRDIDLAVLSQPPLALDELMRLARAKRTAIMCAEAVPWRCHRSLIADALLARGWEVIDLYDARKAQPHKLTPFAKVQGTGVTYPEDDAGGLFGDA